MKVKASEMQASVLRTIPQRGSPFSNSGKNLYILDRDTGCRHENISREVYGRMLALHPAVASYNDGDTAEPGIAVNRIRRLPDAMFCTLQHAGPANSYAKCDRWCVLF